MFTLQFLPSRKTQAFYDFHIEGAGPNELTNEVLDDGKPLPQATIDAIDKFSSLVAQNFNIDKGAQDAFLGTINGMTHKSLSNPDTYKIFIDKAFERHRGKLEGLTGIERLQSIEGFTDFLHKVMSQFAPLEKMGDFGNILKSKKEEFTLRKSEIINNTRGALSQLETEITPP